jgi:hypothetical protein
VIWDSATADCNLEDNLLSRSLTALDTLQQKPTGGLNKTLRNTTSGARDAIHGTTDAAANVDPLALSSGLGRGIGRTVSEAGQGLVR